MQQKYVFNQKNFIWCECEGAIKHEMEKLGYSKIPNVFLKQIFKNSTLFDDIEFIDGEKYDYYRYLGSDRIKSRKCIFGFSNKEILEKWIETRNRLLDKINEEIKQEKKFYNDDDVDDDNINHIMTLLVQYFLMNHLESWVFSQTEHEYRIMIESSEILKTYFEEHHNELDGSAYSRIESILENVATIKECCSFIKPYSLKDTIEFPKD